MTTVARRTKTPGVLFVDLDQTLVATDLLWESLLVAIKRDPLTLLRAPFWLLRGRAGFKDAVASAGPGPAALPYRPELLDFLKTEKEAGRTLVLATASHRRLAARVSEELGLFDDVLANSATHNLKGAEKLKAIRRYCKNNGFEDFGYVGDSRADLAVWGHAAEVYVVEPSTSLLRTLRERHEPEGVFGTRPSRARAALRALRPHQWVKNILVFVPLVLAHQLSNVAGLLAASMAFVAWSLTSSAVYLLNDLLDLNADRMHPAKRRRPFASGALPIVHAPLMILGLLGMAFAVALSVSTLFAQTLAMYLAVTTLYSLWLKPKPIVDVMTLAALYSARILGGGVAAEIPVSAWLMAFSMFIFTSLAFAKRYSELARNEDEPSNAFIPGRGYSGTDLGIIQSLGPSSGYLAVLVLAIYISSDDVGVLYENLLPLWLICPLLLYWISRIWLLAGRRLLHEDPVVYALKDKASLLVGAAVFALLIYGAM